SDIERAAGRYPYAWRARIVHSFLSYVPGDPGAASADFEVASLYREDSLTFDSEIFELADSVLGELVSQGKMPELEYRVQVSYYFLGLLGDINRFGYDPDLWSQFTKYGLLNDRNPQVASAIAKHLPFKPENAPKALRLMMLFVALNTGDADTVRKLERAKF